MYGSCGPAGRRRGAWSWLCALRAVAGRGNRRGAQSVAVSARMIVEQDGCECLAHMPFEMIGEHAQEHVGAHAWADPMEDRTAVEVDGLVAEEGALDTGQALVGAHRIGGIE